MALANGFPARESLGVFLGVAGLEWILTGHADPLRALLIAAIAGMVILAYRQTLNKDRDR